MSPPEVYLWQHLRREPEGVRFRRQHPFGRWAVDFYWAEAKLGIELDGMAHDMGDNPERDADKDAWLAAQGVEVVRIPAAEVMRDSTGVAEALVRMVLGKQNPP